MPSILSEKSGNNSNSGNDYAEALKAATARPGPGTPSERLRLVGSFFAGFKQEGKGWKALCPVHPDNKPSLSIDEGADGRILLHCHAGCLTRDILTVTGLQERNLFTDGPLPKKIVATYDYRDEAGTLPYQVVRFNPKGFQQRRPDGNGWSWDVKGVRKVLYRLPELLAADTDDLVFIPEGEKDVERLVDVGLVATTTAGGAKARWTPEIVEPLRGKHVVLLADNDPSGWDRVKDAARVMMGKVASVRTPELPGLPDKGDVSNWLDAGGTKADLLGIARETAAKVPGSAGCHPAPQNGQPDGEVPGEPGGSNAEKDKELGEVPGNNPAGRETPKRGEVPGAGYIPADTPIPFPVDVFPYTLREYATSTARAMPAPVDFVGTFMLPVLGSLIGRKRCIEIKPGWTEYPLLWAAVVARSGDRKSPVFKMVTEPLRKLQKELRLEYIKEKVRYSKLKEEEKKDQDPPQLVQVLTTDTTVEALKQVLDANPFGLIYPADELSLWVRGMSQYKAGLGNDRQHWLSIWSGMQIVNNRVGKDAVIIDNPFVAVTGGIQPDCLEDVINDAREDGGSARVLFSFPGHLSNQNWTEETVQGADLYDDVCRKLWFMGNVDEPLTPTDKAKALWVDWVNGHRQEKPATHLCPAWAKMEGYSLRLALILFLLRQVCGETDSEEIDEESIAGAIKLVAYFKDHAKRAYAYAAKLGDEGRIGKALTWVKKQVAKGHPVTARMAAKNGLCKDSDEAKQLFYDLAELGYGTVTEEAQGSVVFHLADPQNP
jgi:hypothetical protein